MKHLPCSPFVAYASEQRSRGQALAIFAASLVTLLLIGAIVVDVGFIFMTRRHEQNAADPGAVAAARYIQPAPPTSTQIGKMWTAACFYAMQNGFQPRRTDNNATCDAGGADDDSKISVFYPPSAQAGEFAGQQGYVEVTITRPYASFLARIVGLGIFKVSTSAVAALDTGTSGSSSLVALNPTKCAAAKIHGGGGAGGIAIFPAAGVTDPGGYVQVNSNCGAGSPNGTDDSCDNISQGAFDMAGGTSLSAPALIIRGACDQNGSSSTCSPGPPSSGLCMDLGNIHPDPDINEDASFVGDPLFLIRPPAPTDLPIRQACGGPNSTATSPRQCNLSGSNNVLLPGTYYGGWRINNPNTVVTLNPGIYIIAGGGIVDTNGLLTSASGNVMIFSTDASPAFKTACTNGSASTQDGCQQKLRMNGSGSLDLLGLDFNVGCPPYHPTECPYSGMLAWQDGRGSAAARIAAGQAIDNCDIDFGGGASLHLQGTIYAKCGAVTVNGNNSTSGCTAGPSMNCASIQIISDTWDVGGSAILQMPYDPGAFYHLNLRGLVR